MLTCKRKKEKKTLKVRTVSQHSDFHQLKTNTEGEGGLVVVQREIGMVKEKRGVGLNRYLCQETVWIGGQVAMQWHLQVCELQCV